MVPTPGCRSTPASASLHVRPECGGESDYLEGDLVGNVIGLFGIVLFFVALIAIVNRGGSESR
jgi:hypothetical protein